MEALSLYLRFFKLSFALEVCEYLEGSLNGN